MRRLLLAFAIVLSILPVAGAREWKTIDGRFKIKGDLIAFSEEQVVIKKTNKELISVKVSELSKEDQEYLKSKESEELLKSEAERVHTWTFKRGLKATGRIVNYGTREVVIQKRRGKAYVNDRTFKSLPDVYKRIVEGIIAHFEQITIENEKDLDKWLDKRGGKEAKYTCDGVVLELENGDEYAIPIFLFSEDDQAILKPGWARWSQYKDDQAKSEHERFMLEAQTRAYQQERTQTQVQQLQLGLLAVASGIVWEVCLEPKPGVAAYPLCVAVPAANSNQAAAKALIQYPAYTVGSVRRID
jgi:hypothetical protein